MIQQMDRCTVHIRTDRMTGTGFFYAFKPKMLNDERMFPAILTNNHVIDGAKTLTITLTALDQRTGALEHVEVVAPASHLTVVRHSAGLDLCAIALQPLIDSHIKAGKNFQITMLDQTAVPSQEVLDALQTLHNVIMVGYPNGLWDAVNNKAIFRSGTTATHPAIRYNDEPVFLADIAVFPGSSGSPLFLHEEGIMSLGNGGYALGGSRTFLIGIVFAVHQHRTIDGVIRLIQAPIAETYVPQVNMPNNLGVCIHAREIVDLESQIERVFFPKPAAISHSFNVVFPK